MAWTVKLLEAITSTVDLNDRVTYYLLSNGFHAPPPPARFSVAGQNMQRSGGDIIARAYDNRQVTVNFQIRASNGSALGGAVQAVNVMLRKASEYAMQGLGTQIQLAYQWEAGGTAVYFNILDGTLDLGQDVHSPYLLKGTMIPNARLVLLCEPFAVGTTETLQNWLKDPSFEVAGTALADWTLTTGTGTIVRSTGTAKYGTAKVEFQRSAGTALQRASQTFTSGWTSTLTTLAAGVHVLISSATANLAAVLRVDLYNTAGAFVSSNTAMTTAIAPGTLYTSLSLTMNVQGTVGTVVWGIETTGTTGGTGTVYFDGGMLIKTAGLPNAWVSGRDVGAHLDDAAQTHTNYVDVYGNPGDVTGLIQIKASENEAHTDFWLGARHASRQNDGSLWLEGESFTGSGTLGTILTTGDVSAGTYRRFYARPIFSTAAVYTGTTTSTANITVAAFTGTNRAVAVTVSAQTAGVPGTPTVTYQGTSMTLAAHLGSGTLAASIFLLPNPPTTVGSALVVWGTAVAAWVVGVVAFWGVNQTTAFSGGSSTSVASGVDLYGLHGTVARDDFVVNVLALGTAIDPSTGTLSAESEAFSTLGTGAFAAAAGYIDPGPTGGAAGTAVSSGWSWGGAGNTAVEVFARLRGAYTASAPYDATMALGTPSVGQYRAIARIRGGGDNWKAGVGFTYGSLMIRPTATSAFVDIPTSDTGFSMRDLGLVTSPPMPTPLGGTIGTYTLILNLWKVTTGTGDLDVDSVMLLPVDQGFVYVSKTSARDVVMSDSRSPLRAAYVLTTADILQNVPANQVGEPPEVHPQGSRYYLLADDATTAAIANGFIVTVVTQPRFMHVG